MANVGVVTNADRASNAVRPVQPVLPLERRVVAAESPKPAAGTGKAPLVAMEQADAWTALAALFQAPLPGSRTKGPAGLTRDGQPALKVDGMNLDGMIEQREHADSECAPALGLMCMRAKALEPTAVEQGSIGPILADAALPDQHGPAPVEAPVEAHTDDALEVRAAFGLSAGTSADRFGARQLENVPERQTVLTQCSSEAPASSGDKDTLRFTYHFRSWQGQPAATVSMSFHDAGRKLRVEASDRTVYSALLANRDALGGSLKIVDDGPDSQGRGRGQRERDE